MDRKAILVISVSIVLLLVWPSVIHRLYPPQPVPQTQSTNAATPLSSERSSNVVASASAAPPSAVIAAPIAGAPLLPATLPSIAPGAPEELLTVTNSVCHYTFSSYGGGLKSIDLLQYPESVACNRKNGKETAKLASLNTKSPVASMSLLGDASLMGDGRFSLTRTPEGVRAEQRLPSDLVVVKEFRIGSNYLVHCTLRLENRSGSALPVAAQEVVVGTATPMGPTDDGTLVGFYWGRDKKVEHITLSWFNNSYLGCIPGTPRSLYQEGSSNVTWAAVHNQFFALAAIPTTPAQQVIARQLSLPVPTAQEAAENSRTNLKPVGYQTSFLYPAVTLPPQNALEREYSLYIGPKEYNRLARLGEEYKFDLDQIMGFDQVLFGSFSGIFAKMLLLAMNGIHALGISYGLTIVVITVLIKLLFWPLTQASTQSMKRMQTLQPQIKQLQEKYKDDPAKLNKKMMEFWREHKVNPLGGCLPILLQMPVFIGFFAMIQTAIELRGASFLWACDLTQPDTLFIIPGLNFPVNPMPLLMGGTMLWQAQLQPVAPGMDPMQAKMMKYMPLIFLVMLYTFSSGLTLYWTVQNLLSILQMKLTKAQDLKATVPSPVKKS